jgi:ubiquinone/menaquinone biosynthesis C-methylase UbiE
MNEEELKTNKDCSEYVVHDLNLEPALPFPDNTFDIITNAVSVDYLNKPLEVFQEMHRYAWASRKKITEKIKQ